MIRGNPLASHLRLTGPVEPQEDATAPSRWDGGHVGLRLCEAFRTLRSIPLANGARGFQPCWPAYCYSWEDLLAQAEQGELEKTMAERNRIRVTPPGKDVTRMEIALRWPAQHLRKRPELAGAVNRVALAHALERDAGWSRASTAAIPIRGSLATQRVARSSREASGATGFLSFDTDAAAPAREERSADAV